jgi:hypothetical protein
LLASVLLIPPAEDTADQFIERVFKYFDEGKSGQNQALDYALVVKGLCVYAAGPIRISKLEYFQRCIVTNTDIYLYLSLRKNLQSKRV